MFSFAFPVFPAFPKPRFDPPPTFYASARTLVPNWQELILKSRWEERCCDRMAWGKVWSLLKIYLRECFWVLPI